MGGHVFDIRAHQRIVGSLIFVPTVVAMVMEITGTVASVAGNEAAPVSGVVAGSSE